MLAIKPLSEAPPAWFELCVNTTGPSPAADRLAQCEWLDESPDERLCRDAGSAVGLSLLFLWLGVRVPERPDAQWYCARPHRGQREHPQCAHARTDGTQNILFDNLSNSIDNPEYK